MRIFIMALEPIDTRYTGQWFNGIPTLLESEAKKRSLKDVNIYNVGGMQVSQGTTKGAFLDFAATNIWKNTQINTMAENFANGSVAPGDKILFTDAWHPGVIQIKYMSELLDIPVEIHALWHAGSYDPQDFLGRKVKDKKWSYNFERSLFHAIDYNYFATEFHKELFFTELLATENMSEVRESPYFRKMVRSGQPHSELIAALAPFRTTPKKRQIVFPHRVAPEKQPEIFRDLAAAMPDVEFIICQDHKFTKDEYHKVLAESMIVFSANLQETLGISAMEGVLVDAIPYLPDRLSYSEMYHTDFLYPSHWTQSAKYNKIPMIVDLRYRLDHYESYLPLLTQQRKILLKDYLSAGPMVNKLLK